MICKHRHAIRHGSLIYSDGFKHVYRNDEHGNPLPKLLLVEAPLYDPEPGHVLDSWKMDEALLDAVIASGEVLVIDLHGMERSSGPAPADLEAMGFAVRFLPAHPPTAKPTVERFLREGVLFRASELRRPSKRGRKGNGGGGAPAAPGA